MNILFLTISRITDINSRGIYTDLMRQFIAMGHDVFIASPAERRFKESSHLIKGDGFQILRIKTLNLQKTNVVEKGIGQLMMEYQFDKAISKYWHDIKFDLILYSTPPITFNKVIARQKKRTGAPTYLMLKDIFPQNAVDLEMIKYGSLLHKMFRKKERKLYHLSDKIGCMSPANCEYVIRENPEVDKNKVEVCPNAIMPIDIPPISQEEKEDLLAKLNIPTDKTLFIYGGNLGKPQGIDFLLEVIEVNESRKNSHIIVVGSGTEFHKIDTWFNINNPKNSTLIPGLPKEEYDNLVKCADVGLIFLDWRFTIPNFPSRLLSYLENGMPVLLATDSNSDMGSIAEAEGFGYWSLNGYLDSFMDNMDKLCSNKDMIKEKGAKGKQFLIDNYTVAKVAANILKSSIPPL